MSTWKNRSDAIAYARTYRNLHKAQHAGYRAKYNAKPEVKAHRKEHAKLPHMRFLHYKCGAKKRGLNFELTFEEFMGFWQVPCYYCGASIETVGIDRLDSAVGYVLNNAVSCCSACNTAKSDYSVQEFIARCKAVVDIATDWPLYIPAA
jgi:hypothetical protein